MNAKANLETTNLETTNLGKINLEKKGRAKIDPEKTDRKKNGPAEISPKLDRTITETISLSWFISSIQITKVIYFQAESWNPPPHLG
jgi:hypothetical protein